MRLILLALFLFSPAPIHVGWSALQPLPSAVTNNAVASYVHKDRALVYSFMGVGKERNAGAITTNSMVYDSRHQEWRVLPPVPGKRGRVGASAVVVDGAAYVLGGYTVDASGKETTVADVDIYNPSADEPAQGYWSKGVPLPVPVNDAVAGVVEDRFILLVSGWSKDDTVANVQIYDTWHDHWREGSVISGKPVFGHSGAIANKTIIYCGGAYINPEFRRTSKAVKFLASDECWQGKIASTNPFKIDWTQLPPHPGKAQFHMAAGAWEKKVVFAGGAEFPFAYDGLSPDGKPAKPSELAFAWNPETDSWESLPSDPEPTMDSRQLAADRDGLMLVGGMQAGQKVAKRAARLTLQK